MSGAAKVTEAPARASASKVSTDSCISEPSYTPQPERMTATSAFLDMVIDYKEFY